MSFQEIERPRLWIVAGRNGSGKSTLYGSSDIEGFGRSVWIINPDLLAGRIRVEENLPANTANLQAVIRIQNWLEASVDAYQTVGVETVLSTDKYRALVRKAFLKGFEFRLLYVLLGNVEENIRRVRDRVAAGGHDVPENKIRERRQKSLEQLPWFLDAADWAWIFDNSGAGPTVVGRKLNGTVELDLDAPADLKSALAAFGD